MKFKNHKNLRKTDENRNTSTLVQIIKSEKNNIINEI